jgi:cytochrome P450
LLDTFWKLNFFITINRIGGKFPILSHLKYFFVPVKVLLSHLRIEKLNREAVEDRVARRHEPHPLDHFDSMLPPSAPVPVGREKIHFEVLAGHLLVGGFESVSGQYHCAITFLLLQPRLLQALTDELRTTFKSFEDINAESLVSLPFLNAVMNETLRMTVNVAAIIPRESPGATVDGKYIPKGVCIQVTTFPTYFCKY